MSVEEVLNKETNQRKLLALDGGGIRGMVALGVLERMEEHLKNRLGRKSDENFRLCDYFDYIAGTSTGAIIAACLAWGMSVKEIRYFYEEKGTMMFEYGFWPKIIMEKFPLPALRQPLTQLFPSSYNPDNLRKTLENVFQEDDGQPATLGSRKLKTLLLMILRNATTDSPWPISNNPQAKYNARSREDCNLKYPLWQLIRASTAAPTYFPPEQFKISQKRAPHLFVDGAITPYNNPAFQLFLMATVDRYNLKWPTGADKMLLVSIGTGNVPDANQNLKAEQMNVLYNVQKIPAALMFAAQIQQDFLCRVFGQCLVGGAIDREVGDMIGCLGALEQKLFTYLRYDVELTKEGLTKLGLPNIDIAKVQRIDSVDSIGDLRAIGEAIAEHCMKPEHFDGFVPDSTMGDSPVDPLMPNLKETNWKSPRIGDVVEFWEKRDRWQDCIELAEKANPPQIGDLLILAEEAPIAAFRADASIKAGLVLIEAKRYDFALEQLERGLAIEPHNLKGLQTKGLCLQRLAMQQRSTYTLDRARQHYRKVLASHSYDAQTWSLLAQIDKDAWTKSWRVNDASGKEMRANATNNEVLLRSAIDGYYQGYCHNPQHYYCGINALTLMHVYQDLTGGDDYEAAMDILKGAVRLAAEGETHPDEIYGAKATLGVLEVLVGTPDSVRKAYQEAIAYQPNNWFDLDATLSQLLLLKDLGFRPDPVQAGIETFNRALNCLSKPENKWEPKQVFLFSGHMVDEQGRNPPRFSNDQAAIAAQKIEEALLEMEASTDDLALTQGACGGDLLFTEACQKLGVKVQWMQPFDEREFIQRSVARGGDNWRERYDRAKEKLTLPIHSAPQSLGPPPPSFGNSYPYERCNLWLLYTALSYGIEKVRFICLWDGENGDRPGGTAHMYKEVKNRTGQVKHINTRLF